MHDIDAARRDDLIARGSPPGRSRPAPPIRPAVDLVVNATPIGMAAGDPLPVDVDAARRPAPWSADLVTRPAVTPLLVAARERGAPIVTGADMFAPQAGILADFLLSAAPGRPVNPAANPIIW